MHQESDDRLRLSTRMDAVLVVLLVVCFFAIGGVATYLKARLESDLPIVILALIAVAAVYALYRLRILGYRYTVFYEEPQPQYDPRFDDYIVHEDYPYPVGTLIIERTASAKGTIIEKIDTSEMIAIIPPNAEYKSDVELNCCCHKASKAHSVIFRRDSKTYRLYIKPTDKLVELISGMIEAKD